MCIAVGQVISVPPFSCLKLPLERFFESKICEVALPLTVCLQSQLWDWNSMVGYRQNGYLVLQCDLEFHVNSYVIPCPQEVCTCALLACSHSWSVYSHLQYFASILFPSSDGCFWECSSRTGPAVGPSSVPSRWRELVWGEISPPIPFLLFLT